MRNTHDRLERSGHRTMMAGLESSAQASGCVVQAASAMSEQVSNLPCDGSVLLAKGLFVMITCDRHNDNGST